MSDIHPFEPPYSKTMLTRALTAVGLPTTRAYELALRIEQDLAVSGDSALELGHLEEVARSVLGEEEGAAAVRKLRLYREFRRLDLPIVLMIGGGTGSGKSSVATEVAHRLGITRVTSTDVIRHTMRAFFSEQFMPTIHYSSFEAGRAHRSEDDGNQVLAGFLDQTRNVLVGVDAAPTVVGVLADSGLRTLAIGPRALRLVTHRHVTDAAIDAAVELFARLGA